MGYHFFSFNVMFRKKRFRIIVFVVAILLLCLIVLQVYWTHNTRMLQIMNYYKKVDIALDEFVSLEEKFNNSYYLYGQSYVKPNEAMMFIKVDTQTNVITDTLKMFNVFSYSTHPEDTLFYNSDLSYRGGDLQLANISARFEYKRPENIKDVERKNNNYNTLAFKDFRSQLQDTLNIVSRIKLTKLDSVLKSIMHKNGVYIDYEYGLKKEKNLSYDYYSKTKVLDDENVYLFTKLLFTDIAFNTPIIFEFKIRRSDLDQSQSLFIALVSSATIIIFLIVAFVLFIITVIKQKKLSELKNDFINNMTHEFMTPVTNIGMALETLDGNKDNHIITLIGSENERIKNNISKVLQIAKFENKKYYLDIEPINIHEILLSLHDIFSIKLDNNNGSIQLDLAATNPIVRVDMVHIRNVIFNIIDNAIKYSKKNQVLEINIRTENSQRILKLYIEDNGIGMTEKVSNKIFDKFYRADNTAEHTIKGFGLGLSYVKHVTDALDIKINVSSEYGVGTTFVLIFKQ